MKKIVLATLGLVAAGLCGYTGNGVPTQVGVLNGCGPDAGTTAIAIKHPYSATQFLVRSNQPIFGMAASYAQQAVTDGKYLDIEFNTTTSYNYDYNGGCTTPSFLNVNSVTFLR